MRRYYRLFCPKQNKYKSHEQLNRLDAAVVFAARVVGLESLPQWDLTTLFVQQSAAEFYADLFLLVMREEDV